jgi:hypothetical protein
MQSLASGDRIRRLSGPKAIVSWSPSAPARRSSTGIVGVVPRPRSGRRRAVSCLPVPRAAAGTSRVPPADCAPLRPSSKRSLACSYASAAAGRSILAARASTRVACWRAEPLTAVPPSRRPHRACGPRAGNGPSRSRSLPGGASDLRFLPDAHGTEAGVVAEVEVQMPPKRAVVGQYRPAPPADLRASASADGPAGHYRWP